MGSKKAEAATSKVKRFIGREVKLLSYGDYANKATLLSISNDGRTAFVRHLGKKEIHPVSNLKLKAK